MARVEMNESFNLDQEPAVLMLEPRRAAANVWRWVKERSATLLCTVFIAVMSFNMLTVIARKSITLDETVMIPAAYYHLAAGNFQLVHDHPPLSKILAAVPLLFIQPKELPPNEIKEGSTPPEEEFAYQSRFWQDNRPQFDAISFWSRVPMIALTAALGVLIFVFARDLFGERAAVLAVALFAFEPTMLAHGRVVQTDVPAAFGLLFVCFALNRFLQRRTWRTSALLGLACGVALLSKFSAFIIAPVLLVVFVVMLFRSGRKDLIVQATIVVVVTLLVIQAAYYFQRRPLVNADLVWITSAFPARSGLVEITVRALSNILPTDYVLGAFWQLWHSKEGHPASLLGMYRHTGWWYYFPVAFTLKTSLPFLLVSITSVAWSTYEAVRRRSRRFLLLLLSFAIYTGFVMLSPINIGVRYYLPAYTFLFILGGALLERLLRVKSRRQLVTVVVVVLLSWSAVEAFRAYPDYVTYFNPLASSHPRWWYLSDSNVEWGDDIKALAVYLHEQKESRLQSALLGGFVILPLYGIENFDLIGPANKLDFPRTRYIAIGASALNGSIVPLYDDEGNPMSEEQRVNRFDKYRRRTAEAVFGNSIYLYRLQD